MKVYIAWSGDQSRLLANALRDWLPEVLQEVQPWLANNSMGIDNAWLSAMTGGTEHVSAVIVCTTPTNAIDTWPSIEALRGLPDHPTVMNVVAGVGDLGALNRDAWPAFRFYPLDLSGARSLVLALNSLSDDPAEYREISKSADIHWHRLEAVIDPQIPLLFGSANPAVIGSIEARGGVTAEAEVMSAHEQYLRRRLDELTEAVTDIRKMLAPPPGPIGSGAPTTTPTKPRMFIGSSVEGIKYANLDPSCDGSAGVSGSESCLAVAFFAVRIGGVSRGSARVPAGSTSGC